MPRDRAHSAASAHDTISGRSDASVAHVFNLRGSPTGFSGAQPVSTAASVRKVAADESTKSLPADVTTATTSRAAKQTDSLRVKANVGISAMTASFTPRSAESRDGSEPGSISTKHTTVSTTGLMTPTSPTSATSNATNSDSKPIIVGDARRIKRKSLRSTPTASMSMQIRPGQAANNFSSMSSTSRADVQHTAYYATMVEFIPDTLFFDCPRTAPFSVPDDAHVFSIDEEFKYIPFYMDFGPLSIAHVYRLAQLIDRKLNDPELVGKRLVATASPAADKCSNAATLICCYMVLFREKSAEKVLELLAAKSANFPLTSYRDAGYGPATYWISVSDCVHALEKGLKCGFLKRDEFDVEQYEFYEKVENGDLNWVLPRHFLALATPHDTPPEHIMRYHQEVKAGRIVLPAGRSTKFQPLCEIEPLLGYLKSPAMNIKAMIRLNNKVYDRQKVIQAGIDHYELYFPDGSVPPFETIVHKFVAIADHYMPLHLLLPAEFPAPAPGDQQKGGLAVHCKAGLGRTGTLISCWIMKNFGWTAREVISWCRLMRPGSVVGPQQNWLVSMEQRLWDWGEESRMKRDVQRLIGQPVLKSSMHEFSLNDGTSTLAKSTMGMLVPVQPNKIDRGRSGIPVFNETARSSVSEAETADTDEGDVVQEVQSFNSHIHEPLHEYYLRSHDILEKPDIISAVHEQLHNLSTANTSKLAPAANTNVGKRRISSTSVKSFASVKSTQGQ